MGRRKKQTDIEDAIKQKNGAGHNSTLTDDERRALTLHHKRAYEAADALVAKARADLTAVKDLAKSDLGKEAVKDIKDMITYADEKKCKGQVERTLRLARWLGMPVGTSVDLFDAPHDDRVAAEGMTAGMAGEECKPPIHLSAESSQRWLENWHAGQAVLASAFGKKRGTVDPEPAKTEPTPPAQEPQTEAATAH
jgi:hypothetical protein